MNSFKILAISTVLIAFLTACSDDPSNRTVKGLVKKHYKQTDTMTDKTTTLAGNEQDNESFNSVIEKAMPTLDSVDNIDCVATDSVDAYLCSADITQTMNGHTSINQGNFKVYKANNKWLLDL